MRKLFVTLSGLVGAGLASSAYAEEFTLGGSIDLGAEYGIGKDYGSGFSYKKAYADFDFNLSIGDTTDSGLKFGATLNLAGRTSLAFQPYVTTSRFGDVEHWVYKVTGRDYTDIRGNAYNVSGGQQITEDKIVAIKINSDWVSVGGTHVEYDDSLDADWDNFNNNHKADICKLAGIAAGITAPVSTPYVGRQNSNDTIPLDTAALPAFVPTNGVQINLGGGYLPAGQLLNLFEGFTGPVLELPTRLGFSGSGPVLVGHGHTTGTFDRTTATRLTVVTQFGGPNATAVADFAEVFVGPFASARLQSSTTKMVTGFVCVVQTENSDTKYYQQPVDAVIQATDATVYIEGGFGRLTLQTEAYDGLVEAIGEAGDQIKLDSSGVIAIIQSNLGGVGTAYAAMDLLGPVNFNMALIAGVEIDLAPFTFAFESRHTDSVKWIEDWDAQVAFGSDDFEIGLVTDSTNAVALYGGLDWLGFEVDGEIIYIGDEPHKKSGFTADLTAATTINNVTLTGTVDQDLNLGMDASWLLQGSRYSLEIYGGYAAEDNGGKVGVKVAF